MGINLHFNSMSQASLNPRPDSRTDSKSSPSLAHPTAAVTRIIGIDPGSRLTGYGIIERHGQTLRFVDAGTIRTESADMPERLKRIFDGISRIVDFHAPTEAAVEQVFMAVNPDSALKLGQARGAAITALVNQNLSVAEYTARQIKLSVVGYGAADKEQVQKMVCQLLALQIVPQADAADALAAAICHAHASSTLNKLQLIGGMTRGRGRRR